MRCQVISRLVPLTDGMGAWPCPQEASVTLTFPERQSNLLRGPFYVCALHATQLDDAEMHDDAVREPV